MHLGQPETVDKEIEDIDLALKLSAKHAGLKSMFAMGPQRIFYRVMLASIVQIMLQVTHEHLIHWGQENTDFSVHGSQFDSLLHPHHLGNEPEVPSRRSRGAHSGISGVCHPRRHHLLVHRGPVWQESPDDIQRCRNVGVLGLCYWPRIVR